MGKKRKRTSVEEAQDDAAIAANEVRFTTLLEQATKEDNFEEVGLSKRNLKKKEKKEKKRRELEAALNSGGATKDAPELVMVDEKDEDEQDAGAVVARPDEHVPDLPDEEVMDIDHLLPTTEPTFTKKPKKSLKKAAKEAPMPEEKLGTSTAHLSVLNKFKKLQKKYADFPAPEPTSAAVKEIQADVVEAQGLEPLPQPAAAPEPKYNPLSSLPSYLAQPTLITDTTQPVFSSFGLSSRILTKLSSQNFIEAFPVQAAIIPLLLKKSTRAAPAQDLLVSASTGSGKTLSYLIPIIESLSSRIVTRIQALIIVPTRELVVQVQSTAEALAAGSGLKIGTALGTRSLATEGEHLAGYNNGAKGVDIVVATPGRLVEHIRNTPGFTLQDLKWLVIDEADRLLGQSFQEWVDVVIGELEKPLGANCGKMRVFGSTTLDIGNLGLRLPENAGDVVRKVVLSATMTRDVGKLSGLKLRRPNLIVVDGTSSSEAVELAQHEETEELQEIQSLPPTLSEHYLPASQAIKPLILKSLLASRKMENGVLIFTKSNESAARLGRLLELLSPTSKIAVCFGEMRKKEAAHNVVLFRKGDVSILICTDLISRGMDISTAQYVINYDTPRSLKDYIHRVGRTARAGNYGEAWNLVENEEGRWWWKAIGNGVKRKVGVKRETLPEASEKDQEKYQKALRKLGGEVRGE